MSDFRKAYDLLRQTAQNDGLDAAAVELFRDADVRSKLGQDVPDMTTAQVRNLKRLLVGRLQEEEDVSAADRIVSSIIGTFADAQCEIRRIGGKRIATVYLDGRA